MELESRLAEYMRSEDFQMDIATLAHDYLAQGLPVPPAQQLRSEAIAEVSGDGDGLRGEGTSLEGKS